MNRAFSRKRHVAPSSELAACICPSEHATTCTRSPELDRRCAHHHVDPFVVTSRVLLDDQVVYTAGAWNVRE